MLTPRLVASATLTSGAKGGSLVLTGRPAASLAVQLAPFFKGDTGAVGAVGPAGPQGLKGDTGAKGEPGDAATAVKFWGGYIFWPSAAAGSCTVSGQAGAVRAHTYSGATVYRFIPTAPDPALDAFYSSFASGALSGFIVSRG